MILSTKVSVCLFQLPDVTRQQQHFLNAVTPRGPCGRVGVTCSFVASSLYRPLSPTMIVTDVN